MLHNYNVHMMIHIVLLLKKSLIILYKTITCFMMILYISVFKDFICIYVKKNMNRLLSAEELVSKQGVNKGATFDSNQFVNE